MGLIYLLAWALLGILSIASITTTPGLMGFVLFMGGTAVVYALLKRGSTPFTAEGVVFFASRWSRDNLIFPTQVAIQPTQVIRHKGKPIGAEEESISITQVASVRIDTGWLWSDVIIESTGGANPIICHGHLNTDARQMKDLIQEYQEAYFTRREQPNDPGRPEGQDQTLLTVTLIALPPTAAQDPITVRALTCHLPARPEEAGLEAVIAGLLAEGPEECSIQITRGESDRRFSPSQPRPATRRNGKRANSPWHPACPPGPQRGA